LILAPINLQLCFPAAKRAQPRSGSIIIEVVPNPMRIPCSKNPTACPGLWPVGGSSCNAISLSLVEVGRGFGGVINCGRGVEKISGV